MVIGSLWTRVDGTYSWATFFFFLFFFSFFLISTFSCSTWDQQSKWTWSPHFVPLFYFIFLHELCIFNGGKIGLVIKFIISIEFVQFWNNFSFSFSFYVCFVLILHLSPFFFFFGERDCTFYKTSKPITRHYQEWYLQYNQKFLLAIWSLILLELCMSCKKCTSFIIHISACVLKGSAF